MHIYHPNDRLRELRVARKVSRKQLSTLLGISHFTLGRWERGESFPSTDMIEKLCAFFQLSPLELGLADTIAPSIAPAGHDIPPLITSMVDKEFHSGFIRESLFLSPSPQSAIIDPMIPLPIVSGLVGRAGLLIKVVQRLCSYQRSVATVVHGLPGMGKTAMATAISHNVTLRKHFVDGILWAGLGPHPNLLSILGRWGKMLGISTTEMSALTSVESWSKALRATVGARKFLIVVDDVWQLEEALACKVGGENCQYLVTTRFPSLASQLTIDGMIQLQELSEDASIALLDALITDVDVTAVPQIPALVRSVGGLPLALTLIGSYVRAQLGNKEVEGEETGDRLQWIQRALQRLEDTAIRLQISEPNLPAVSHPSLEPDTTLSLQSIIAVTDQFLGSAARFALYIFSLLPAKPDSFSEAAALAVANCTIDELDALAESGLLECTVGERYALHQVIADYARLHLTSEDKEQAVRRLIAYCISYIHEHKRDYELLSTEGSTIVTALELAYELEQRDGLVKLICVFAPYLILRGFYSLAEQHLQQAYSIVVALEDEEALASVLLYQGEIALKQSNLALAEERLEAGLQIARRVGNEECICDLLTDLGSTAWKRGQYAHAEELLQRGLSIARHIESHERMERILKFMGSVFANQGKYIQAIAAFQEGLELARQVGDREQECFLLGNVGAVVGEQGDIHQAEAYFYEGLELARQIGIREQECVLLVNLGNIKKDFGAYLEAEQHFRDGLLLARQIGHLEWVSVLLCDLGSILLQNENTSQAEVYMQESLELARSIDRPQIVCHALHEYGYFHLVQQNTSQAEDYFREMLEIVPEGDQIWYAFAYYGLARVAAAQANFAEARQFGKISLEVLETIGHGRARDVQDWLDSL